MVMDIWKSLRSLPLWVQIWVMLVLVPVNMATLLFLDQPGGALTAALAIGALLPNAVLMYAQRGFSKATALSHLLLWTPLLVHLGLLLRGEHLVSGSYQNFLVALLVIDLASLAFDFPDAIKWWRGDRAVAGAHTGA
ncbi:hypothetical protein HGD85_01035 [Rhodobacteraceae bacterium R_SAG10]|nr:hypothetical protein [Rhodobacteraceae bacterium R_SAG10]